MGIRIFAAACSLVTLAAFAAEPIAVGTVVVGRAQQAGVFELEATIEPVRQATVAAQVGGNVLALAVKAGDRVKAGQPIARIDERDTQAGLQRADAAVAQAQADARQARTDAERSRELRAQGFVSSAAQDNAETRLQAAEAALRQAQAARSQAALARGFASVAAPFDAVVLATHVEAGDLAAPGRAIATVYSPEALRATVQVPASRAATLGSARRVEVVLGDGRLVAPSATTVLPSADPVSQTVEWRLDLPRDAVAGVRPGRAVRVRYTGDAVAGTLAVPTAALLRRGELTAVYLVQNERFVLRAVRIGASAGATTEVLAGLKAGDRVAVNAVRAGLAGAVPSEP